MSLREELGQDLAAAEQRLRGYRFDPVLRELGEVVELIGGVARVRGLPHATADELLVLAGVPALAFDLREDGIGAVLLARGAGLVAGGRARRTFRVAEAPIGDTLLGRVVGPLGRVLDDGPPLRPSGWAALDRPPPELTERAPVRRALHTGVAVIDALLPIGRGQRELLVGDRQTGKTSLALTAVLSQRDSGVLCVVCSIGQRAAALAGTVAELRSRGALRHTTVVAATADAPAGLQYLAPFAAMTLAESWARRGRHVLLILDDLTRHARAYRELALLLRRPPGREAYPGDIFFLHARLLERACNLAAGGSITALPILEVEGQDLSAFIPTNLISISDGQVVLSERLARKGVLPPVDVGLSVSRVGGRAQGALLREIAGDVRLDFAQFEELEAFTRFAARLDDSSRQVLRRGRRVRAAMQQAALEPLAPEAQLLTLAAVAGGVLDTVPEGALADAIAALRAAGPDHEGLLRDLEQEAGGQSREPTTGLRHRLRVALADAVAPWRHDDG